jgi:copper transport protein
LRRCCKSNGFLANQLFSGLATVAFVASALALLLLLVTPTSVFAHAYPVGSEPAPNATVQTSPERVRVWFGERVEPSLSHLTVLDATGQPVPGQASRVDRSYLRLLEASLPLNLPRGTYTAVWRVVSSDDGHLTTGSFTFGLGVVAQASARLPTEPTASSGATVAGVLGRWLLFLGVTVILGVISVTSLAARSEAAAQRRLRLTLVAATGMLLVGQALRLIDEMQLVVPGDIRLASGATLVFGTRFGALWIARLGLVGLLGGFWFAGNRAQRVGMGDPPGMTVFPEDQRWPRPMASWFGGLLVALALAADLAFSGHAAVGTLLADSALIQATLGWATVVPAYLPVVTVLVRITPALSLIVDWLHLVAVGLWIGGLVALAACLDQIKSAALGPVITRFSRLSRLALAVVLLTGLYNLWLALPAPAAYLSTAFGQSLLLKHLLVVALLLAAALNHFVTRPLLAGLPASRRAAPQLRQLVAARPAWPLRIEAGLGVAVLLATGLLTSQPPARTPQQVLYDPPRELGSSLTVDPRALVLLDQAEQAMSGLGSVRIVESLGNGADSLSLARYTFAAPDRSSVSDALGDETIQLGSTVYHRANGGEWRQETGVEPYQWPTGQFGYLHDRVGAVVVAQTSLQNHDCLIVAFYSPRVNGTYEVWIGVSDHLIYQEVMNAPAHYMVSRYYDHNQPVELRPPT